MASTLHPNITRQLLGDRDLLSEIDQTVKQLAALMAEMHGGPWKIGVNHDHCFAIVSRDFSDPRPVDKSNYGGN